MQLPQQVEENPFLDEQPYQSLEGEYGFLIPISQQKNNVTVDWATWFGLKQYDIIRLIHRWNKNISFYDKGIQALLDHEMSMIDELLQQSRPQDDHHIARRQFLVALAALPLTSLVWEKSGQTSDSLTEIFLCECAASTTTCWHLLRGKGLEIVAAILPQYASQLMALALSSSPHQQIAARIATQVNILQAIVEMHKLNIIGREMYCLKAVQCSRLSQNRTLHAAALMYLGYTYSHCYHPSKPQKAISIFQQALEVLGNEESLLRSDILMGLAEAHAQCKEEQEALLSIGLAQDCFPSSPELDPSFIYADCGLHTLYQWQGKMYLQLIEHFPHTMYQQKAVDSLMQSIKVTPISRRSASETLVYQAEAARVLDTLETYASCLEQAIHIAREIGSQKRYNDAMLVYKRMPEKWAKEPKIRTLAKEIF